MLFIPLKRYWSGTKSSWAILAWEVFSLLHNRSSHASRIFSTVWIFCKPSCSQLRSMCQCEITVMILVIYAYMLLLPVCLSSLWVTAWSARYSLRYVFLIICLWKQPHLCGFLKLGVVKVNLPLKFTAEMFVILISFSLLLSLKYCL